MDWAKVKWPSCKNCGSTLFVLGQAFDSEECIGCNRSRGKAKWRVFCQDCSQMTESFDTPAEAMGAFEDGDTK